MARSWLAINVELVEGRGDRFWPRPGRIFAASRAHSFAQLADAIDAAFARWDRSHLHAFTLADATRLTTPFEEWDEIGDGNVLDDRTTKLSRLTLGEQFLYLFDFGDDWTHLCTVSEERIDPLDELGIIPPGPLAYWGWGAMPDQYGRRFADDDGEMKLPKDPGYADLPPLRPWWGRRRATGDRGTE